jgi:sugar lactone lactonase YvrE
VAIALIIGTLIVFSPVNPLAWAPPDAASAAPRCDGAAPALTARVLVSGLPGTPDGFARSEEGYLYTALSNGEVARIDLSAATFSIVGQAPGARLTGITAAPDGTIYAADEVGGAVYRFAMKGTAIAIGEKVLHEADGRALRWTNDVAVAADGALYVTTSSQRRTLDQFFFEVLDHRGSGQLIRFDPRTNDTRVLQASLNMTNGVAMAPKGGVLVAESSTYSVRRFGPDGAPAPAPIADNLPGFPGNIRAADRPGVYWLTLLSPRNGLVDRLAGLPWARRLLAWAPDGVRPKPQPFHCLVRITLGEGPPQLDAFRVEGPADMPSLSTALETRGKLYATPAGLGGASRDHLYVIDLAGAAP